MTHKIKAPTSENGGLEYFFSLCTDTGSKDGIDRSKQKNKSAKVTTIKKTILIQRHLLIQISGYAMVVP